MSIQVEEIPSLCLWYRNRVAMLCYAFVVGEAKCQQTTKTR